MRNFREEDYQKLIPLENKLQSAVTSKYVTGMTSEWKSILSQIYKEVFGRQANPSCPGCVLQMMIFIGKKYFEYKQTKEDEKSEGQTNPKQNKSSKNTKRKSDNIDA